MFESHSPKSVVIGVDGSQAAVRAALWAADEVAGADIPLRLLYIREPNPKTLQLVVVGAAHASEAQQLFGPAGALALRCSDFSLPVVR